MVQEKILRPDGKGRVCLGALAQGISGYRVHVDEITKEIHLTPYMEIPLIEHWLLSNPTALESINRGMKHSAEKKVRSLGSFANSEEDKR